MRRILSMLLVLVVGLPFLASAFAQAHAAQVPVCCRRGGAHRCMEMAISDQGAPQLRAFCPAVAPGASAVQTPVWLIGPRSQASSCSITKPSLIGQVEAGYRIALGRSGWKRGPPQVAS